MKIRNLSLYVPAFVKNHFGKALAVAVGVGLSIQAGTAHAVSLLDTSSAATAITAELTPAITAAMPIAGTIVAVTVGWKMFKRFTH